MEKVKNNPPAQGNTNKGNPGRRWRLKRQTNTPSRGVGFAERNGIMYPRHKAGGFRRYKPGRYVKDGKVLDGKEEIYSFCKKLQKRPGVKLKSKEKTVFHQTTITEAERTGQQVEALAVCSNHVHLVVRWSYHPIGEIVSRYKNAAMFAPGNPGRSGRIWTRGYDKRFCVTEDDPSLHSG